MWALRGQAPGFKFTVAEFGRGQGPGAGRLLEKNFPLSQAEGTKEERPLGNTQGGALSTQH